VLVAIRGCAARRATTPRTMAGRAEGRTMKRTWEAERAAAVRWLRWKADRDEANGFEHEARLIRGLARCVENGQHCMEGPPASTCRSRHGRPGSDSHTVGWGEWIR